MTYSDSTGDNAELLRRTLTQVTDFSSRSRRTEVIYYWIASTLVGVVLNFAAATWAGFEASLSFGEVLRLLLAIPMFALFVRRLHDQDRSGWWATLLPASILLTLPLTLAKLRGDLPSMIAARTGPLAIASDILVLAVFVLCLMPGTSGPNRYGPDPRLE